MLLRLPLLLILTHVALCARRNKGELCTLGGQRYEMGQTWHPVLEPYGENTCVNCTCHQGGEVKCRGVDCPRPDCEEPKMLSGQCCPTCDDFDNLPPTAGTEGSEEDDDRRPGCQFEGVVYKDGDTFPSNRTGLRPTRQDQCVMCVCATERVLCHLKTCLPTKCTKFVNVPDDCCPQCADQSHYKDDYLYYILSDPKEYNKTEADCPSSTGPKKNGTSWNPIIGSFGEMKCIVCTCMNGRVNCTRLECPSASSLLCKKPRHITGSCCKQCPQRRKGNSQPEGVPKTEKNSKKEKSPPKKDSDKKNKRREENGKKKDKRKKEKTKDQNRQNRACKGFIPGSAHPQRKANVTSVASVIGELCLPRGTDHLVYRQKGDNFELVAFDIVGGKSVEILRWKVDEANKLRDTERQLINAEEFRRSVTCKHIIGAINKRGSKKLMDKMNSKLKECEVRGCSQSTLDKVINRERRLKPVSTRHVCGD